MALYSSSRFARIMDPRGRPKGAELVDYLKKWDVRLPPAARRRWRRRACRERREQEEQLWESENMADELSTQSVSSAPPDEGSESPPAPSRRVLAAVERVWELEQNPDSECNIDDWEMADSNQSKIGRTAEHAALLLDVFGLVKPVDDKQLTTVQKGLVTEALSSVLEVTKEIRLLTLLAQKPLKRLPIVDDPELCVYLGCVVCYAAISEIMLMPCCHLALCEMCCEQLQERVEAGQSMRCPVCRTGTEETVKIFRA